MIATGACRRCRPRARRQAVGSAERCRVRPSRSAHVHADDAAGPSPGRCASDVAGEASGGSGLAPAAAPAITTARAGRTISAGWRRFRADVASTSRVRAAASDACGRRACRSTRAAARSRQFRREPCGRAWPTTAMASAGGRVRRCSSRRAPPAPLVPPPSGDGRAAAGARRIVADTRPRER